VLHFSAAFFHFFSGFFSFFSQNFSQNLLESCSQNAFRGSHLPRRLLGSKVSKTIAHRNEKARQGFSECDHAPRAPRGIWATVLLPL
jgi:hypothetical protein